MFRDLPPEAVYEALGAGGDNALFIDCRTQAEWAYVGIADISATGARMALIEWQDSSGTPNADFTAEVAQLAGQMAGPDTEIYIMCRSGARSAAACHALAAQGYRNLCNVSEGFEGDLDSQRHRARVNGWKFHKLPWQQK